jgi:hypothetical protein
MKRRIATAMLTLLLAACASGPTIDFDPATDFSRYQRYQWLDERSGVSDQFDPLLAKRVRNAVDEQLKARFFKAADTAAEADFLVRYYISSSAKVADSKARGSVGMGSFGGNVGMGVSIGFPIGGTRVERQAQVLVDFLDARTQELTWRGSEIVTLRGDDPAELTAQVQAVIAAILDKFPPK